MTEHSHSGDEEEASSSGLVCEDVVLRLSHIYPPETSPWGGQAFRFDILTGGEVAGTISLRPEDTHLLTHLSGQIGFSVEPAFRGRGLAAKAVRALLPVVRAHGLKELWITTTPENTASQRTLEKLGCTLVESLAVPEDYQSHAHGEREKLRYRMDLPT